MWFTNSRSPVHVEQQKYSRFDRRQESNSLVYGLTYALRSDISITHRVNGIANTDSTEKAKEKRDLVINTGARKETPACVIVFFVFVHCGRLTPDTLLEPRRKRL